MLRLRFEQNYKLCCTRREKIKLLRIIYNIKGFTGLIACQKLSKLPGKEFRASYNTLKLYLLDL